LSVDPSTPGNEIVARPRGLGFTPGEISMAKDRLLEGLRQGWSIARSASYAGVSRIVAVKWRHDDPDFAAAWFDAVEAGTDLLEDEARDRAVNGYAEPVFFQGELVGERRVVSDQLMALMLKGRRPSVYGDRVVAAEGEPLSPTRDGLAKRRALASDAADALSAIADAMRAHADGGGEGEGGERARDE
jgi:hypothetical protein